MGFKFGDKVTVIKSKSGHKLKHLRKGVVIDLYTIQDCIGVHTEYPNNTEYYFPEHLKRGWKKLKSGEKKTG